MAKDACLECGKSFPVNKQLASVPLARLVAFDPDANRVWRICTKCHHWNLLGPEASAAAIPELTARFAEFENCRRPLLRPTHAVQVQLVGDLRFRQSLRPSAR